MFARSPMLAFGGARGGGSPILRPQDVFQILTQPANQMQAAINALPFSPDILIDKDRVATGDWSWRDSARGFDKTLASNTTAAETAWPGYSGTNNRVVFALKQQAKVAVRVPYTGDGASGRVIPHGLGIKPGMIIVKRRDGITNWSVWHTGLSPSNNSILFLNTTDASASLPTRFGADPAATGFTLGSSSEVNATGGLYVAYLFAHDPDTTNGIVQCGSYTTDAGGMASVNLGWQPQFLLLKSANSASNWSMFDAARGFTPPNPYLWANSSNAESTVNGITTSISGFSDTGAIVASGTVLYLAIRAPIT